MLASVFRLYAAIQTYLRDIPQLVFALMITCPFSVLELRWLPGVIIFNSTGGLRSGTDVRLAGIRRHSPLVGVYVVEFSSVHCMLISAYLHCTIEKDISYELPSYLDRQCHRGSHPREVARQYGNHSSRGR